MTRQELRLELLKLQEQGLRIAQMCQAGLQFDNLPQYSQRHLQDHPLYKDIGNAYFFRNDQKQGFDAMLGLLDTIGKDNEYWQQPTPSQPEHLPGINVHGTFLQPSVNAARDENQAQLQRMPINRTTIFISHRSIDKDIADMLFDFLIKTGIAREAIFCSSLPGNDVKQFISAEVKEAIKTSQVNIAILSKDYYESAYCVNEAGVMWYLDNVRVIPITLPEITSDEMIGFLNKEYKPRHLDNSGDIAYIYDTITEILGIPRQTASVLDNESKKLIAKYTDYIANRGSLPISPAGKKTHPADLGITIVKFDTNNASDRNASTYQFDVIFCNQSERTLSVYEKYLHFYRGNEELKREEVTRYEVHRRKDDLDDLLVLEPVNGIITLAPGHAEQAGIIRDYNDVKVADKVTFTCIAEKQEYEVIVFNKEDLPESNLEKTN